MRGYRIDIWEDVSKQWHSLCQRKARYDIGEGTAVIDVPAEEGTVRLAATTSSDPASNQDIIWLHETLVAWPGWSLCAPPLGRTIGHDLETHTDPVKDAEPEVPPGLRLRSEFNVLPGSLPRLRYGRRYWLRARVVDLAGNSLDLQTKDFGPENPGQNAQPYYRYEPISAPAIALLKPTPATVDAPAEGESMERMAVRSFNDTPTLNSVPTPQRTRRVAVPSRTTQRDAEQHGVLDHTGAIDPALFAMLAAKDNSLAQERLETAGPLAGGPRSRPDMPPGWMAMLCHICRIHLRMRSRCAFSITPFSPTTRLFRSRSTTAPSGRTRCRSRSKSTTTRPTSRTMIVPSARSLSRSRRPLAASCELSVQPGPKALKLLGVWNWLTPAQQIQAIEINGHTTTLERLVHEGQHWMLTPWRNSNSSTRYSGRCSRR